MDMALSILGHRADTAGMAGMEEFGALVKSARTAKGMTGPELAAKLGRAHSFVVRLEKGTNSNPPEVAILEELEQVLGLERVEMLVSLGYLKDPGPGEPTVSPAERAILREVRAHEWTPAQVRAAVGSLRAIAQMGRDE
jgi:transcriptional regulator with XRE-family HTH domain